LVTLNGAEKDMLRVENLDVAYGHLQILRQVNMNINNGEIVAILGANGAGKTTLLKSVMGLLPPKAGKVFYRGEDVTGRAPFELSRRGIAFVPEERNIFGHDGGGQPSTRCLFRQGQGQDKVQPQGSL
jgi:branched-chain amino acid transport system ATP-binding protein